MATGSGSTHPAGYSRSASRRARWARRTVSTPDLDRHHHGLGRELFAGARALAVGAEQGAMTFGVPEVAAPVQAALTVA